MATVEPVFNLAKNVGISTKAVVRLEENVNLITDAQNVTGNTQLQVVELKNVKRCDLSDLYKLRNSPINVFEVEKCLLDYPEITAAAELIQGLRFGFKLMYAGPRFSFTCKNSSYTLIAPQVQIGDLGFILMANGRKLNGLGSGDRTVF